MVRERAWKADACNLSGVVVFVVLNGSDLKG
jgi:hypothetical protein